jgi:LmbE family N-acetylglucosaminyl deacetylase
MALPLLDPTSVKDQKVVAFSAHSDDVEFMAGGTLLLLAKQNHITQVITTNGQYGTHDPRMTRAKLVTARKHESQLSAKNSGVKQVIFWDYPDLGLRNWRKHFFKKTLKFLLQRRPQLVIVQDPWSRYGPAIHPDHRTLAETVLEALLCATLPLYLTRRGYDRPQILSPKPQVWLTVPAEASHAVNITSVMDQKIDLLKSFSSQFDGEVVWEKVIARVTQIAADQASALKNPKIKYAETIRVLE